MINALLLLFLGLFTKSLDQKLLYLFPVESLECLPLFTEQTHIFFLSSSYFLIRLILEENLKNAQLSSKGTVVNWAMPFKLQLEEALSMKVWNIQIRTVFEYLFARVYVCASDFRDKRINKCQMICQPCCLI